MARAMEICSMVVGILVISLSVGGRTSVVKAQQVQHIVGGDKGWHPTSDLHSWSSDRHFRVGDNIWFTYSAAEESISELRTKEEYESCDTRNPIKMYTDGVTKVDLDGEGIRYFVSSKWKNCKNGLKLHVEVLPEPKPESRAQINATSVQTFQALAAGPTSGSVGFTGMSILVWLVLALVFFMG